MISDVGDALDAIIDLARDKEQAMTNANTQSDIDAETLRTMGANIRTQYNAGTADPMFVVFQKKMVAGLESGYEDFWLWVSNDDGDYEEADAETAVVLKRLHDEGGPLVIGARTYKRTGCRWIDIFCAAFLTQKGAEDYLACNGHNLKQPFIYVHGMYRNAEMIAVRNFFLTRVVPA